MDYELCNKAAKAFNSPLWELTARRLGGKTSERYTEYRSKVDAALLEAGSIANLPEGTQAFLDRAEQSTAIAKSTYNKVASFLTLEELEAIESQLLEGVEEEELEE